MKFACCLRKNLLTLVTTLSLTNVFLVSPTYAGRFIATDSSLDSLELPVPVFEDYNPDICSNSLSPAINRILQRPEISRGKWAILVQSLGGTNIYSLNPDSYMIAASNMKLLVTAAALQKLDRNGQIRSTPIRDWIAVTNLRSNNTYANVLLRYLGGSGSVRQALTGLGIDTNGYRLRDGSGLSRNNLATPRTLVSTLKAMYNAKGNDIFWASLPVAGISGTLKNRLRHTTAEGSVRAKTGTLKGVRALSGYIERPDYSTLIFSIITNQPNNKSSYLAVKAIDEIVLQLSTFSSCE